MTADDCVVNTFSYIWYKPAVECVRHLAGRGYRRFEMLLTAPHLWPADFDRSARAQLLRLVRESNASIVSVNAGGFDNNLASPAEDVRRFAVSYLSAAINLAADLEAAYVVLSPGIGRPLLVPPYDWLLGWFRKAMDTLVPRAESAAVQLLVENIPFAFLPTAKALMEAIGPWPEDRVGMCYDVANAVYVREDPIAVLRDIEPRLRLIHLSDTPLESWRHDAVGRGVVPFKRFGQALRELRYRGPAVLEVVSRDPDGDIDDSVSALSRLGW